MVEPVILFAVAISHRDLRMVQNTSMIGKCGAAVKLGGAPMFRWVRLSINGRPLWVGLEGETEHLSGLLRSVGMAGPKGRL